MRRRTFDTLMSTAGLLLSVVLVVAGALLVKVPHFSRGFTHPDHKRGFDVSFPLFFGFVLGDVAFGLLGDINPYITLALKALLTRG